MQSDIEHALQEWSRSPLTIIYLGSVPPTFNLAQYNSLPLDSLKKKLTQFPGGTRLALSLSSSTASPDEQKAREEILDFAAEHGITVTCVP